MAVVTVLATASSFSIPAGITIDTSGNLFVADTWNNKIRKITITSNTDTNNYISNESYTFTEGVGAWLKK